MNDKTGKETESEMRRTLARVWMTNQIITYLSIAVIVAVLYGLLFLKYGKPVEYPITEEGMDIAFEAAINHFVNDSLSFEEFKSVLDTVRIQYSRAKTNREKLWEFYFKHPILFSFFLYLVVVSIRYLAWPIKTTLREKPKPSQGQGGVGGGSPGG